MRYTHFHIQNYRGIADVRLDLQSQPRNNIFTLIGLNESGKTTILEAINFFIFSTDLDPLDLPGYTTRDVHELIPISKRSNFNDGIAVEVGFECDEDDEKIITKQSIEKFGITLTRPIGKFTIKQVYQFKNSTVISNPSQPRHIWDIKFEGKGKGEKRSHVLKDADWKNIISVVKDHLPSVHYFPNFLFELPDRIYLEEVAIDPEKHEFYRDVLQDVLDSIGDDTNLKDHVLERAKSGSQHDKRSMDSVLLKMGENITATVYKSWNRIFKRVSDKKEISVAIDKDEIGWYLQLRLKDGSNLYSISERSLGFRWFFAFLLLTQYRGFRKNGPRGVLFLFDEPASNLHPSAQSQLLESFGRFESHAPIIYTTHSHHMVNPKWLEGTYVVKNEGIDYTGNDEYTARQTLVTLHRYRTFAANHPDQSTYFQPVLDVLAYQPSKLENVPNVVMMEGKNDFYTLKYLQFLLCDDDPLYLLPGTGSGSLSDIISLYIAWGRNFIVMLDSDEEGNKQKERYEELFGQLIIGQVQCLEDVDSSWANCGMEYLLAETDRLVIQQAAYPDEGKFKKTLFNRAVQELLATEKKVELSSLTLTRFQTLLSYLRQHLHT